ncbi:hypothetical protein BJX64DRAFT_278710 [Aspergillus heterothallicus]
MAVTLDNPPDDKLSALWHAACADYAKQTGTSLEHGELPQLRGPEDLSRQLEAEKDNFRDFRMKRRPLLHAMSAVLAPFETWGGLITVASFPPASTIMGAMLLLVQGVRKVSEAFDTITDMFRKLGHFALRLESYKGVPLSEGMKVIIVKVLVNFLRVCAASQKFVSRGSFKGRLTQWAKSTFMEDNDVNRLLGELEELTSQEHMMVSAHGLKLTNQALRNTEELLERDDRRNNRERLQTIKAALSPVPGSSQVFSSINDNRIPGSGAWVEKKLQSWWEGSEPILWLHGGPGVGKSFIASKIITELSKGELSAAPAPVVASFFCRNNDVDLRSLNKALRTLAWQVVAQRDDFAEHAEAFCLKEDVDNSYIVWQKLLVDYLTKFPSQGTCLVIDGIDEAEPEEQEILCSLLEKTFSEDDLSRPPLRIVMLSRDSLRGLLDEHSLSWIDEVEVGNNQNKDDLHGYVDARLQKTKLFRGSPEFQEEIVKEISREAQGMWEWANLVIKSVLRCRTKEQIRKGIRTMPRGISAMLTQELQRLARELSVSDEFSDEEERDSEGEDEGGATQIDQLNVLLSFVTIAQKPLSVRHLAHILEIIFKEEVLNLEDDLRTTYSSLFLLRPNTDDDYEETDLVILRHSSFYEFFRTTDQAGPVAVNVDKTEVDFLYVLLYALREIQTPVTEDTTYILRQYAENFLPTHFTKADPAKAGKEHGKISALIYDLFTEQDRHEWFIDNVLQRDFTQYCFYATSCPKTIANFWIDSTDRELLNQRAEMTLQWLLPGAKLTFEEHARASTIASDTCPFTVLFSYMAEYWLRLWLEPESIIVSDGRPAVMPRLLTLYVDMAKEYSKEAECRQSETDVMVSLGAEVSEILAAADLGQHPQTPFWHARVAQALLQNRHYSEARERFQITLAEHEKNQSLDASALPIIHRDLGRALSEIGRHEEALRHHEIFESLAEDAAESDNGLPNDGFAPMLNIARLQHRAKRTDAAIETAIKAWEQAVEADDWWESDLESFFNIFLELHQPQHLRPVFDCAFAFFEGKGKHRSGYKDFADFIFRSLGYTTRVIYQVLQYVLTAEDHEHLDRIAGILERVDTVEWRRHEIPVYRYLISTVLFTKGRVSRGVDGWCQVITDAQEDDDPDWGINYTTMRSIGRLVAICLEQPDIPPSERFPVALGSDDEIDEACLVLAMWLRRNGDTKNAREALRGRVKHSVALLSDDDISNDEDAFKCLFNTFVADPDSVEDRDAALYLIKKSQERRMGINDKATHGTETRKDASKRSSDSLAEERTDSGDDESEADDLRSWLLRDDLSECVKCCKSVANFHFWYFCRSRPFTTVCRRCYRELQASDEPSEILGSSNPEDDFYYIGGLVRESERVEEGMVPIVSGEERKVIWVEEWKDSLAEKWKTKDFAYEGGFAAWCLRVLPEPQRTRWAAFFQT